MNFVEFSFCNPAAGAYEVAQSCHIMIFVGFGSDPKHIQRVLAGLRRSDNIITTLPTIVRQRVQWGRLWWIGMCGGAMCAGYKYRHDRPWLGLDLLEGVNIDYSPGWSARDLGPSQTDEHKLVVTSFAGIAIWTRRGNDGQKGSSFTASKNGKTEKQEWCNDNQAKLEEALKIICNRWHWPTRSDHGKTPLGWAFRLDGWVFYEGEVRQLYPKNREDR